MKHGDYIVFTLQELEDMINGCEIEFHMADGSVVYFMNEDHFRNRPDYECFVDVTPESTDDK